LPFGKEGLPQRVTIIHKKEEKKLLFLYSFQFVNTQVGRNLTAAQGCAALPGIPMVGRDSLARRSSSRILLHGLISGFKSTYYKRNRYKLQDSKFPTPSRLAGQALCSPRLGAGYNFPVFFLDTLFQWPVTSSLAF